MSILSKFQKLLGNSSSGSELNLKLTVDYLVATLSIEYSDADSIVSSKHFRDILLVLFFAVLTNAQELSSTLAALVMQSAV
jgi:hypothetical protein